MNLTPEQLKKYRDKKYAALHKTAKEWFHKFIRLRDTDENGIGYCISSGRIVKYGTNNCQAGHFYPAGSFKSIEFNENNVHVQSLSDNYYRSANLNEYRPNLIKKIGQPEFDNLVYLAQLSKATRFKEDRFLMIEVIETYKVKVKELAKCKNFKI